MRSACSRNQVFHWAIARMLVGKSSHMLHVQFAAVMARRPWPLSNFGRRTGHPTPRAPISKELKDSVVVA